MIFKSWMLGSYTSKLCQGLLIHTYLWQMYLFTRYHRMDFISPGQSNSNAGWLTWECMSNIFKTGFIIIFDSLVCSQFGHTYSIHWKETTNEEKNYNKGFVLTSAFPKSKECVFTLRFQHHHKIFSFVIKIWAFSLSKDYILKVSVFLKMYLQLERGFWGILKLLAIKICI